MQRSLILREKKEADSVFKNLQWTRVKIQLDDRDRETAKAAIEDLLKINQISHRRVLFEIAYAIRHELFKSKEIDVETIQKLAAWFPRCLEIDDNEEHRKWLNDDFKLSPDSDSDSGDEGDEDDAADEEEADDGDAADEVPPPFPFSLVKKEEEVDLKKREAHMKEFEQAGMNELERQCDILGCSLKQGQEKEMLSTMISFFAAHGFRIDSELRIKICVEHFMSRVKSYISSTCTLKDLGIVKEALRSVKMRIDAEFDQLQQQLENNTVPTNEEGNECEIAAPFYLPEQQESATHRWPLVLNLGFDEGRHRVVEMRRAT